MFVCGNSSNNLTYANNHVVMVTDNDSPSMQRLVIQAAASIRRSTTTRYGCPLFSLERGFHIVGY